MTKVVNSYQLSFVAFTVLRCGCMKYQ